MRAGGYALGLLLTLVALGGCLGDGGDAQPAASADLAAGATDAPPAPLGLAGARCIEGGGHSVHPRSLWEQGFARVVPDPWVPADVIDDVGPQLVFSEYPDPTRPIPEKGNTMGNYHATTWCEEWTLDGESRPGLFVGFVGMKVEPPEFDADAANATHHYLITVLATNDDALLERFHAAGFLATRATAERAELPDGTLRIRMFTDDNGDYDSLFKPKPMGDMHATRVRLWWQHEPGAHAGGGHGGHGDGPHREGEFHPIALDLVATGGAHLVAEAQGWFSHTGTEHHEPLPGAYGKTAAILYRGFDRAFEWGPRPDVTLDLAYEH